MHVVMLTYPNLTQLDLTGPYEVLARFPELSINLVWKTTDTIKDALGLRLCPSVTYADCAQADILFVPGGPGQLALMQDGETLEFLRQQAQGSRWITAVCTGSLVLAAAGLLEGYRATCHWMSLDQLALFDCTPVAERVVRHGNRLTGAGVTSGIDFALTLGAELFGEDRARRVQLAMEYDPAAPFSSGSPATADAEMVEQVRATSAAFQGRREQAAALAAETLRNAR